MEEYLSKIRDQKSMKEAVETAKKQGKTVVFTNGCFDILHRGHVGYLSQAKKCGDYLVVGLNSDRSVRALKGKHRPLTPEKERAELLAALCFVDGIVVFEEKDPLAIIKYLQPHVLVKGADWAEDDIIGAEEVKRSGGKVKRIPLYQGISTSDIIRKIVHLYSDRTV
jgi:D-beta-D-heptose 7-phosphate kinase/D-beta-D-heptose 1-phosphate adenosyltransferase